MHPNNQFFKCADFKIELSIHNVYKPLTMCDCAKVLEELKALRQTVEEMVLTNNAVINRIANNIELKIDILANSEAVIENQKANAPKKLKTKQTFFKDLFKEDKDKFIDVLYTQDQLTAAYAHDDVKSRKAHHKDGKAADIIYKEISKSDALEKLYSEYKAGPQTETEANQEELPELID
jgi:hypothetical protein